MTSLEIKPKTIGEQVVERIIDKGFTPHLNIDCPTRIAISIDEDLTEQDISAITNGMPAWLKGQFELRWTSIDKEK